MTPAGGTGLARTASAGPVLRRVEVVMGVPVSLAIRGRHTDDRAGRAAWSAALASLRESDRVFSHYRTESWISRLGRGEVAVDDCPAEVREVLDVAEHARVASQGAFDVWRPGPDGTRRLDTAGVVKGWAVERAAQVLAELTDTDFCLSGGGDMVCRNASVDSPPWRIGIEDPHDPQRLSATVPVHRGAVATSGTAHRGTHLVDARTGGPPVGVAQVTVIGDSLTWVDIAATAAYAHGTGAARWLAARADGAGLVVWEDGTTSVVGAP